MWFFKKHGETKDLACIGFINQYRIKVIKWINTKGRNIVKKHGESPSEDMMPTGHNISK
tara:strand:+ start:428 stop:604 length:177 start_codon:yes stop_codon:yes gene_type:complete